jgi:hypothetical protein
MLDIEYRMFFNNEPATRKQLDMVEEITVEQEVDMAWEARINIPICTDEKGNWSGEDEDFMAFLSPIRIEIKVGDNSFVPLIDGPVVGYDSKKKSEPCQSFITLIVQDDSMLLNREDSIFRYENMADHEIADKIFKQVERISSFDIEKTPNPSGGLTPVTVQRGTGIRFLRSLAKRQGLHAYVLPGEKPGKSIGCFKSFPTETDGLAPLILMGSDRNTESFNPINDAQGPAVVSASTIRITDKKIIKAKSRFDDLEFLGEDKPFPKESDTYTQTLGQFHDFSIDPERAVDAEAAKSCYSLEATGNLFENYNSVLKPYHIISVRGINKTLSGNYLIWRVTHNLTLSSYSQSFSLKRNALSGGESNGGMLGSIF